MHPKVKLLDLSKPRALQIVREAAKDSARVYFTMHASKRMRQRRISLRQVLRCLAHGRISEGPARDLMKGGWRCTLEHLTAGESIGIAVAIEAVDAEGVVVITVFQVS